jgi:hypothetical protein
VVAPFDLDTLAVQADLVIRGTAESTSSSWSGDGRRIFSLTRVSVSSSIKGQAPTFIEILTPGGSVGKIGQKVWGAPEFAPGEQVILFLRKRPHPAAALPRFEVAGLAQGKFSVVREPDGTNKIRQQLDGLGVLQPTGAVRPAPAFEPVSERDFLQRIRSALQRGRQ